LNERKRGSNRTIKFRMGRKKVEEAGSVFVETT